MDLERANALCRGTLPGLIGLEFTAIAADRVTARLELRPDHLAPNGYLHGSTVTALAETACGFGTACAIGLGEAAGFASVDLTCNFVGTAREGVILCEAASVHAGRTTHVWDARVFRESDARPIALFRCTQLILDAPAG